MNRRSGKCPAEFLILTAFEQSHYHCGRKSLFVRETVSAKHLTPSSRNESDKKSILATKKYTHKQDEHRRKLVRRNRYGSENCRNLLDGMLYNLAVAGNQGMQKWIFDDQRQES
uniref:Uncharacterized protein n=1 Tax=Romanomermis culicivorax TaxID=13658 RepID=A0A915K235_ROMCU